MVNRSNSIRNACHAGVLMLLMSVACPCAAQFLNVKEIEPLINEWNFAHNTKSLESFRNVYSSELLFYTEQVGEERAVTLKQDLFTKQPTFTQKIVSPINYTAFTSGVIKCDFTKEVSSNSGRKRYPSYLLVSYENKRYWIVGESDDQTDKVLRYRLELGDTLEINQNPKGQISNLDSIQMSESDNLSNEVDSTMLQNTDAQIVQKADGQDTVSVPKLYVYILIFLLVIALVIVVVMSAVRKKRVADETVEGSSLKDSHDDSKVNTAFNDFVLTLFDPLYFSFESVGNKVTANSKDFIAENVLDYEMHFRNKDVTAHFAIKCAYIGSILTAQVFSAEDVRNFRLFEIASGLELYCIIGIGGKPDDPKHVFLVPVRVMKDAVTKDDLEPYKKYGMFFFNDAQKTLR